MTRLGPGPIHQARELRKQAPVKWQMACRPSRPAETAGGVGRRTPMGSGQWRRLSPHAVVVSPRFSAYSDASKAVFEIFEDTTPLVEGLSIDEAFLDVSGLRRVSGTPRQIAAPLRCSGVVTVMPLGLGCRLA